MVNIFVFGFVLVGIMGFTGCNCETNSKQTHLQVVIDLKLPVNNVDLSKCKKKTFHDKEVSLKFKGRVVWTS